MTDTPDSEGRLPLHYAALDNEAASVAARLRAGDPVDAQDHLGFTALHFAAQQGSVEAARLLLEAGADVDAVNVYGNTPLFVAVLNSHGEGKLIELLRAWGADPVKENASGQSPVALARMIANFDVAQFFTDIPLADGNTTPGPGNGSGRK
jgi:ankyrin repeat protein